MMVHAWTGYKKHAWGANELAPISGNPHSGIFSGTRIGLTIVDSLDTLYTMGLFEEVQLGKMWLKENLTSHLNVVCTYLSPQCRMYLPLTSMSYVLTILYSMYLPLT